MLDFSPAHFATVVLFHNGYGDYVMASPTLRAICSSAPRPLALICGSGPQQFLLNDLDPDLLLLLAFTQDWPRKDFDSSEVLLRISSCDTFLSLCPYQSCGQSQLIERLPSQRSIGYTKEFAERLPYKPLDLHEIDVLFQGASLFAPGIHVDDFANAIRFGPESMRRIAQMREALGSSALLIAAHIDTRPERSFPRHRFDVLLHAWTKRSGVFAALLNEKSDLWPAASANGRCVFLRGSSLEQSMAVAASADLFIGVDSCMLHVADFARRPGLGLFSPTEPARAGFRFSPRLQIRELRALSSMDDFDDRHVLTAGFELLDIVSSKRDSRP